jgi:antitoxin component YwqK of YwqJK toxin-antitoxin module
MKRNSLIFSVLLTAFLFSCEERNTSNDPVLENKDSAVQSMTVAEQNNKETGPMKVKDSITDGVHVERYDNGVIYMRGDIAGGVRHGEWITFFRDGTLWSKGTYVNGYREGYGISYFPGGKKSSEGYYLKNKMVGVWKFWDEQGNLISKNYGGDTTQVMK